ncbi:MAG TPA: alpha-2-macroglobulin family protein [Chitinophagaceae bacterium]|nr:alpha-2-macroglobulin family protein [Chitinophagaceae bacterium]
MIGLNSKKINQNCILLLVLFIQCTFFSNSAITQVRPRNYIAQWEKVEALMDKGLTKTAITEVKKIYTLAKKEGNEAQAIKSLMFQTILSGQVDENAGINSIKSLEAESAETRQPAKSLLQSMTAQLYWNYFQNNRWRLYSRTNTENFKKEDIATWGVKDFHNKISALYLASISEVKLLQSSKLEPFDAIIQTYGYRYLRSTLYDFLSHRALDYFTNDERDVTKPAYQFIIRQEEAFADAPVFSKASFKTKDTASLYYKAITIFQQLTGFHLKDAKPDALIDLEIKRLQFMHNHAVLEEKEKLYERSLIQLTKKYANDSASAQVSYLLASFYNERGNQYTTFSNKDVQYEKKRAKEICEAVIAKFPKSEGGINCKSLLHQIVAKSFTLTTEKVNVPDQPFRMLVNYKNISKLYFRIIKTSKQELKRIDINNLENEDVWEKILSLKSIRNWNESLPDLKDYQQHSVEVKINELPNGLYVLLASEKPDFSNEENILALHTTYVSNISFVKNNSGECYILNRESGNPLANAKVQVWEKKYDYQRSEYSEDKKELLTTDKNGYTRIKSDNEGRNFLLEITHNKDYLFLDDSYYVYREYNPRQEPTVTHAFLFTDRSIYRPGQTMYFKGIVMQTITAETRTIAIENYKSKLILRDANGQKVGELNLTTNEFGSYHGSFKLPEGTLNGNFSILDSNTNAYAYFNVEEYKRPKFYVEVKKPDGTYRVNENITVKGNAKAYAGNNIDGATVKYRVVRRVRMPIWWDYGFGFAKIRPPRGSGTEMEITNGETNTDANGEFKITFKAIPDESVDKASQPTFIYEVSADVTDINGETRSSTNDVAVAYQALQLNINMPSRMPADSLKSILISSKNMNDIFESTNVNVTIHKLQAPNRIFRERLWLQPDQFLMSKEEYYNYFPYDVYADENEISKWNKGDKVADENYKTEENSKFIPYLAGQSSKFVAGWYEIVVTTKDKYGEMVTAKQYVELYNSNSSAYTSTKAGAVSDVLKGVVEPGEKASYQISTADKDVWMVQEILRSNEKNERSYINLNSETKTFDIIVNEDDRGGISTNWFYVQHNRVYTGSNQIDVPWTNKELKISYESFRDKTLPGSEEKWTLKVSGIKGDKVAAEMLASMYDASLDQFKTHNWADFKSQLYPDFYGYNQWSSNVFGTENTVAKDCYKGDNVYIYSKSYDVLVIKRKRNKEIQPWTEYYSAAFYDLEVPKALEGRIPGIQIREDKLEEVVVTQKKNSTTSVTKIENKDIKNDKIPSAQNPSSIQIRKNFNETAFFLPDLKTDSAGNISFSFTIPEALTEWKFLGLAHTKDMRTAITTNKVVTQKQLMVQPNAPRFMREGDKMEFSTKVSNLTDKTLNGTATLQLFDATTMKPVDELFKNGNSVQSFTAQAGQSAGIKFSIDIPFNYNSALVYRVVAQATSPIGGGWEGADGEENSLPVLTNRMLVTESITLPMRGEGSKNFSFEKLLNNKSTTLSNHALTVEYTSNPTWYAVQALPYLMEYPYECAEQTFNRYYANALAAKIANASPKIKAVFEKWKTLDTAALLSNLQKNEELKSALLQETPWVLEAKNEEQQKKNIALLFDMVKLSKELESSLNKLKEMQSPNGGFVWFKGGPDDRYITQYIITGIGHLQKLGAIPASTQNKINSILKTAVPYLDRKLKEDYDFLIKQKSKLKSQNIGYIQTQWLYMRSFFPDYKIPATTQKAYDYYRGQSQQFWLKQNRYAQGMTALALHRTGDNKTPTAILASIKDNSIVNEEMGMYFKDMSGGYYWHQAPVETQALLIEAFSEAGNDDKTVDDLKTWLLKQKQTQNWKTTKATAEACYALLLKGSDWLSEEPTIIIQLGDKTISNNNSKTEVGTGYFKERIDGKEVKNNMGNIKVTVTNPSTIKPLNLSTSWGAIYWQYFEDLDKISSAETPLKLSKKLFVEKNSDNGPVLIPINDGDEIKIGDKVKVRIELRADRDMEYVHMKDMRAACMEPVNVLSHYKWQGGLGYYESTKDASTNFFFNWLPKGTYVFEYPLFVTHSGNFSNGVTTIQCMYAPEFSAHSEGVRVKVK